MKFSLTQKGIILVAIPLIFEFLFVGVLAFLLTQAEEESARVFHSANIGNCSNKLIKDVFELSAITHSELVEIITSGGYEKRLNIIRGDLKDLEQAAKGNPAQELIAHQSAQAGDEAFMFVEQLRNTFESGGALAAMDQLKQLRGELRTCIKRMISSDLIAMAQEEKKKAEEAHNKQLEFRKQIKLLLIIGLVLNAAITIVVAFVITKKIVGRLNVLVDNNFRLASRLPLNPPVKGSDEIAELDKTFHDMAIALAEAKQKEKSMIEHSVDLICSLDGSGRVTAMNPACKQILGYSEEEILGMNLRNILFNEDIEQFNTALISSTSQETQSRLETRLKRKDGKLIDLLWSLHWVEPEQSFFCVGHDVTARKEMERLKQQFMAMISHDLRTPLSTISNYLEMLAAGIFGKLNEKGERLLTTAETNTNRMLSLINDLLDLESAEFGGLKLNQSTYKLSDLLEQAVKSVNNLALKEHIKIEVSPSDLTVSAD